MFIKHRSQLKTLERGVLVDIKEKNKLYVNWWGKLKKRVLITEELSPRTQQVIKKTTNIQGKRRGVVKKALLKVPLIKRLKNAKITDEGHRVIIEELGEVIVDEEM